VFGGKFDYDSTTDKPRSNFDSFWQSLLTVFQVLSTIKPCITAHVTQNQFLLTLWYLYCTLQETGIYMANPLLCILLANNFIGHSAFSALFCMMTVVILKHHRITFLSREVIKKKLDCVRKVNPLVYLSIATVG